MNAPAKAFRCQALAKEIAAELRAKYDLKAACLPVNVCLLRAAEHVRVDANWHLGGLTEALDEPVEAYGAHRPTALRNKYVGV
jgi:hypothetical protein